MRRMILIVLMFGITSVTFGQTWQRYQLTNFPEPGQVRQCGSVADSLGNIHTYFIATANPEYGGWLHLYYIRTSPYGRVLTDTVRVDTSTSLQNFPVFTSVVGDGLHSWCVWSNLRPNSQHGRGLFLTERNSVGEEVLPMHMIGWPATGGGPPDWDLSAALRTRDSTIHIAGNIAPFCYSRIRTNGDTLIWNRPIDGMNVGVDPEIHLGPDGVPWAAMRNDVGGGQTEIVLVRFGEDTSQTVYHPFGRDVPTWYVYDFGIDARYDFHFMVNSDTVGVGYIRLDSTMQVQESHILDAIYEGYGTMKADSAGNCLFVWDRDPGLYWAYRTSGGFWSHESSVIGANLDASSFSIVSMDSARFAFTCQGGPRPDVFMQAWLYTYGYPPDATTERPDIRTTAASLVAYPNPFSTSLHVEFRNQAVRTVVLYDLLGRIVLSAPVPRNAQRTTLTDPRLSQLPTGTYFLTVEGSKQSAPQKIIHFK
jgi:hypothetical protein